MRVNLDEKAMNDPRFRMLARAVGMSVPQVIGVVACGPWMCSANRVSDENPSGLLTRAEADHSSDIGAPLVDAMITADLAHVHVDGRVYFSGLRDRGAFLLQQRARGASGGQAKAERKRTDVANAKPTLSQGTLSQGTLSAPRLSLTSGSGSGSGSGSCSGSEKPSVTEAGDQLGLLKHPEPEAPRFDFEALYKRYPRKRGKPKGLQLCKRTIRTQADFEALGKAIDAYARDTVGKDQQYVMHFSSFMGTWRDYLETDASPTVKPRPVVLAKPAQAVDPVAPDALRDLAAQVLVNLRRNG